MNLNPPRIMEEVGGAQAKVLWDGKDPETSPQNRPVMCLLI